MSMNLAGKTFAILATDGFEQSELQKPRVALEQAEATVEVVSPKSGRIRGWMVQDWGDAVDVDVTLDVADAERYDGLVLPGGVINADRLRVNAKAVDFVRHFVETGKPMAVICHAPWLLIETGAAKGRALTSYPTLRTDLENAGATWQDADVVVDGRLVTSRKPDDLEAFTREMIKAFADGRRSQAAA